MATNVAFLHISLIPVLSFAFETLTSVHPTTNLNHAQPELLTVLTVNVVRLAMHRLSPLVPALEPLHWSVSFTHAVLTISFVLILRTLFLMTRPTKALLLALTQPILKTFLFGLPTQNQPCGVNVLHPITVN